eukprot:TRINITY_DN5064_c0_g1_i9.p2 TRINITY_DN5064_c0_g1~~TRINITY_DN5064_c0_g1_i9.p2  ORF type:complete len:281 (-),score=-25.63 TRINITY_DN5064_c0_g1_i9:144-911(-)
MCAIQILAAETVSKITIVKSLLKYFIKTTYTFTTPPALPQIICIQLPKYTYNNLQKQEQQKSGDSTQYIQLYVHSLIQISFYSKHIKEKSLFYKKEKKKIANQKLVCEHTFFIFIVVNIAKNNLQISRIQSEHVFNLLNKSIPFITSKKNNYLKLLSIQRIYHSNKYISLIQIIYNTTKLIDYLHLLTIFKQKHIQNFKYQTCELQLKSRSLQNYVVVIHDIRYIIKSMSRGGNNTILGQNIQKTYIFYQKTQQF